MINKFRNSLKSECFSYGSKVGYVSGVSTKWYARSEYFVAYTWDGRLIGSTTTRNGAINMVFESWEALLAGMATNTAAFN